MAKTAEAEIIQIYHIDDDDNHHAWLACQLKSENPTIHLERIKLKDAGNTLQGKENFILITDDQLPDDAGSALIEKLKNSASFFAYVLMTDDELPEKDLQQTIIEEETSVGLRIPFGESTIVAEASTLLRSILLDKAVMVAEDEAAPLDGSRVEQLLSQREKEVLLLIARGQSNKDIARTLDLSYRTVVNHVYNVYSKLGIHSRSEAIVIGMDYSSRS
jgi:DNA-binding NarL/FixJ family response regulator